MSVPADLWPEVSRRLDEALNLEPGQRPNWLERLADDAPDIAPHVRRLLLAHERSAESDPLRGPPSELIASALSAQAPFAAAVLSAGQMLGPYCLLSPIGEGGMASVWLAEQTLNVKRRVALKVPHYGIEDAAAMAARFQHERDLLAGLEHRHIARLYDAGISASGQPYLAMEWIDGLPITQYADEHRLSIARRIALFQQVLQAVQHAHGRLVIHRDLKPSNILVTTDGQVKLLDFGIARLLGDSLGGGGDSAAGLALTPETASPEQLAGAVLATPSDVYSLGVVLYELLAGRRPYRLDSKAGERSTPALYDAVMAAEIVPPSETALDPAIASRRSSHVRGLQRALAGDLDAIVGKALMKQAAQRYDGAEGFHADLVRWQEGRPVAARRPTLRYRSARFLARNRTGVLAGSAVVLALCGGLGVATWQATRARQEAQRSQVVKNFLVQIFKASDPRVASNTPRGQATARELLDAGEAHIESDFRAEPALQVELLGVVSSLYAQLREKERHDMTVQLRRKVAAAHPGQFPAVEIDALTDQANEALEVPDRLKALPLLQQLDGRLTAAGLDDTAQRAAWWGQKAQAEDRADLDAQERDYQHAVALYQRVAPRDTGYVQVLTQLGELAFNRGQYELALQRFHATVEAADHADQRVDGDMLAVWGDIGIVDVVLGRYDDAVVAFERATVLTERTYGKGHPEYWRLEGEYAALLHMNGQRDEAIRRFEALRHLVPEVPVNEAGWSVLSNYGGRLAAQGEPERAIAWLEGDEKFRQTHSAAPYALRRARLILGNAYSLAGRRNDARRLLRASYEEYRGAEPPTSAARMGASERWARILLEEGQIEEARALFKEVLGADNQRHLVQSTLGQLGLSRVELKLEHPDAAVREARAALERWHEVRGYRDVRVGPVILREQARALLAAGDVAGARAAASQALAESTRYDAPSADSIVQARSLLQQTQTAH